ncbi:hypothetical protein BD779DRAFT_1444937 [Infundibulicybe gibba]|nr:hypothetical protein BD779DRAFT_1444937 [Infundibulicybe gibba]
MDPCTSTFASTNFIRTNPPDVDWKYGQGVSSTSEGREWLEGEGAGWKIVDPATENPSYLYQLLISGIVPRPIAFISSISPSGTANLAPFSWFNQVSANPPVISVSCSNGRNNLKDSTSNIKATGGFTVNIISEPWVTQANVCSVNAPHDVSEWPISGLTKEPSIYVKAPRVKESAFSMECEVFQMIDIIHPDTGRATTTLILGLIKYIHIRKDVLAENGTVDPARLKPISRLGDITYAGLGTGFRLARPSWENEEEAILDVLKGKT